MDGNCHFIFGLSVGISASMIMGTDFNGSIPIITGFLVGSIFPDIDNPNSHFGKLTKPISTVIGKASEIVGKTGSNHRGIFHDLCLYMGGFFLCYYYQIALIWFCLGGLSHLLLDMFNPSGIPILLGQGRLRIAKLKSGDTSSIIVTWILTVINPIAVFFYTQGFQW